MSIKQMNASYLLHEDRILFRFNTHEDAEYRFWFTRRVTLFIIEASDKLLVQGLEKKHENEVAKAIAEFSQNHVDETLRSQNQVGDTSAQQYMPGNAYPIGVDPLLIHDVRCAIVEDGLSIDLVLPGKTNLNLRLPMPLVQMMRSLLLSLAIQAGWIISMMTPATEADSVDVNQGKNSKIRPIH